MVPRIRPFSGDAVPLIGWADGKPGPADAGQAGKAAFDEAPLL